MPALNWIGKEAVINYHKEVPFRLLNCDPTRSVGEPNGNLLIEGDNLEALKALLPYYAGQVKCIYIDPPYNTGNENWVYNDNVNSPQIRAWLGRVVGGEGEDLSRHDKWLCMMYPRLQLLWELLSDDGLIFVSIDDNEVHNLRQAMSEVFGEACFKNCIVFRRGIKSVQAQFDTIDTLAVGHEYVLMYAKSPSTRFKKFTISLDEPKAGAWNNHWRGTDRPTMRYELFGITPSYGQWRWSQARSLRAIANYQRMLQELGVTTDEVTQTQIDEWYQRECEREVASIDLLRLSATGKPEHYVPPTDTKLGSDLWTDLSPRGSADLNALFGRKVFDNPKPVDLVKRIVEFATNLQGDDIVLDSFAGSGTTGHAVLQLNREDSGDRRFILVELERDIARNITAERLRRVIQGYTWTDQRGNERFEMGLGDGFRYCTLGATIFNPDGSINLTVIWEDLARHIWFTETRTPWPGLPSPSEGEGLGVRVETCLGTFNGVAYYLYFNGIGGNTFGPPQLAELPLNEMPKVVYADTAAVEPAELDEHQVTFKQIPYDVKVY